MPPLQFPVPSRGFTVLHHLLGTITSACELQQYNMMLQDHISTLTFWLVAGQISYALGTVMLQQLILD